MVNRSEIAVVIDSDRGELRRSAIDLADRLGLAFAQAGSENQAALVLAVGERGLELRERDARPGRGLRIDLSSLRPTGRGRRSGGGNFSRSQPLGRAVGKTTRTVLDATAGVGHDAALLACMGYQVLAVERSPIIAALLQDALKRALEDESLRDSLGERLQIVQA